MWLLLSIDLAPEGSETTYLAAAVSLTQETATTLLERVQLFDRTKEQENQSSLDSFIFTDDLCHLTLFDKEQYAVLRQKHPSLTRAPGCKSGDSVDVLPPRHGLESVVTAPEQCFLSVCEFGVCWRIPLPQGIFETSYVPVGVLEAIGETVKA